MKRWKVYQFTDSRGHSVIKDWLRKQRVPTKQIAEFQENITALERLGPEGCPGLIFGPIKRPGKQPITGIYKIKLHGNKGHVQLRPLLCYGPFDVGSELTLLFGAIEKDNTLDPKNCLEKANENRSTLLREPGRRRRERLR
jgi:hypothetical protein